MRRSFSALCALLTAAGSGWAAEPANTSFAVVVHPSNTARDLPLRELASLFEGGNRRWPTNAPVVLVERDSPSAPFRYLMVHLLNTTAGEYKRRLQNIEYSGDAPVSIKILNSDAASCQFVFNVPTAIALIEAKSLLSPACTQLQVLRIDGKRPGDEGYRLR